MTTTTKITITTTTTITITITTTTIIKIIIIMITIIINTLFPHWLQRILLHTCVPLYISYFQLHVRVSQPHHILLLVHLSVVHVHHTLHFWFGNFLSLCFHFALPLRRLLRCRLLTRRRFLTLHPHLNVDVDLPLFHLVSVYHRHCYRSLLVPILLKVHLTKPNHVVVRVLVFVQQPELYTRRVVLR
jgi:hypothetical protein